MNGLEAAFYAAGIFFFILPPIAVAHSVLGNSMRALAQVSSLCPCIVPPPILGRTIGRSSGCGAATLISRCRSWCGEEKNRSRTLRPGAAPISKWLSRHSPSARPSPTGVSENAAAHLRSARAAETASFSRMRRPKRASREIIFAAIYRFGRGRTARPRSAFGAGPARGDYRVGLARIQCGMASSLNGPARSALI